jgi:hypothetical protein
MADDPVTMTYTPELYADICESMADYHMTGWTVCGAEDPAVIELGPEFGAKHPELAGHTVVRVIDRYVNPSHSETLLEFSSAPLTAQEQALADEVLEDLG